MAIELLARYTRYGVDVTLYYYEESNDYVVTLHRTTHRHVSGESDVPVKMCQEYSTDNYRLANKLFEDQKKYIDNMI